SVSRRLLVVQIVTLVLSCKALHSTQGIGFVSPILGHITPQPNNVYKSSTGQHIKLGLVFCQDIYRPISFYHGKPSTVINDEFSHILNR
ncbi:hypothetical protein L9F63_004322, partial [Diploptera punctata]